jgi:gluconolactonase
MYLAQTYPRVIEKFRFETGKLISEGILCTLAKGRPDGIAVDREGNLWVCTPGTAGLEVFTPDGQPLQRIEFGEGAMTTNCCFGGPAMTDFFVTAAGRGSVLRLDAGVRGLPLYPRSGPI